MTSFVSPDNGGDCFFRSNKFDRIPKNPPDRPDPLSVAQAKKGKEKQKKER